MTSPVLVEVRGTFADPTSGRPLAGSVTFTPSAPLQDATSDVTYQSTVTAPLDHNGSFTVQLVATDADGIAPMGVHYDVTYRLPGSAGFPWPLNVHVADTGAGIDLVDVAPAVPQDELFSYALTSTVAALSVRVTALEDSEGGGGTVTSVNGVEPVDGDVTLTAASIGAASASAVATTVAELQSADTATASALADEITGRVTAVSGEATTRAAADAALASAKADLVDLAAVALSGDYNDLDNKPTLGSAAGESSSAFDPAGAATSAQTAAQSFATAATATETTRALGVEALKADLVDGLIPASQIPPAAFENVYAVADVPALLALDVPSGEGAIATVASDDDGNPALFLLPSGADPTDESNWFETSYDAAGLANAAQVAAEAYTDSGIAAEVINRNAAIVTAITALNLGTAATHAASDFDTPAARAFAITSAITALGLGTAATHSAGDFDTNGAASAAQTAAQSFATALVTALATVASTGVYNDLTGKPALGGAASKNVGAVAGTVAAGDDSRIVGAVQTGSNPASGVSVTTSGLVIVTHTNVQGALADLDAAIALRAPIDSPTFTTLARAPTPATSDSSTKIATTQLVDNKIAAAVPTVQTYTPAWTSTAANPGLGNGTLWGRYVKLADKQYRVTIGLRIGSTTTFGTGGWLFSLPSGVVVADLFGTGEGIAAGTVLCSDSSAAGFYSAISIVLPGTASGALPNKVIIAQGGGQATFVGPASPFTWAVNDELEMSVDVLTT